MQVQRYNGQVRDGFGLGRAHLDTPRPHEWPALIGELG